MEAFGLLVYGFSVLLTWKILALMMVAWFWHLRRRAAGHDDGRRSDLS